MRIDLTEATDAWYIGNRDDDYRYKSFLRHPNYHRNPSLDENFIWLFYIEKCLEQTGQNIYFERLSNGYGNIVLHFNSSHLDSNTLIALMNVELFSKDKRYVFYTVDAEVHEEHGYGYDESMATTTYPRISITYKEAETE